jgi:hypothetical protein
MRVTCRQADRSARFPSSRMCSPQQPQQRSPHFVCTAQQLLGSLTSYVHSAVQLDQVPTALEGSVVASAPPDPLSAMSRRRPAVLPLLLLLLLLRDLVTEEPPVVGVSPPCMASCMLLKAASSGTVCSGGQSRGRKRAG